jgi:CheY-like chemotaxis protein
MRIIRADDLRLDWVLPTNDSDIRACSVGRTLDEWFAEIGKAWTQDKTIYNAPAGLYLIHAHGKFTNQANRQDLEGVELLKHIRLTDWLGALQSWHAIVYSFEPLENILRRKPGDLILTSPGVTFLRLPNALDLEAAVRKAYEMRKEAPTLKQLAEDRGYRAVLDRSFRPFIACDYVPPDSDHAISNWWGARQVILGLRKLEHSQDICRMPTTIETSLCSVEIKKAMFLNTNVPSERKMSAKERGEVKDKLNGVRKHFAAEKSPLKIVYIDDEMNNGWDEAVYRALTGNVLPPGGVPWFHTTMGQLAQDENSPEDWQALADMVLDHKPDLILSDLRLLGNKETRIPVEATSGAKLVERFREMAPGVPILLLTASNKAWTFQEVFRLGVDAYWMKEGIGEHASPNRSIENTAELMRLLSHLLGPDYQLLRKIQQRIDEFERAWTSSRPPWWKNKIWPMPCPPNEPNPPGTSTPDPKALFPLLRSVARSYREYLRLFVLRYGSRHVPGVRFEEAKSFWLQSLVVHVGRIVEAIHGFDDIRKKDETRFKANRAAPRKHLTTSGTIGGYPDGCAQKMRRDWFGQSLYDFRNIAAHFFPENPLLTGENIRSLLAALFAWLSTEPACQENPHSLRVSRNGSHLIWPKAHDFFKGPDMDPSLVPSVPT